MKREALAVICMTFVAVSFRAQAQVSFFEPPTYAGSGNVFVADFNGDGKPDILTSDGTMNLGNGDGTFALGTPVAGASLSMPVCAVADFNGDGKPDVLEQGTGTLLVLLGNGDGTFQAPIGTASGASLTLVAASDLNGDGKADVVGVFGSSLMVYISKGDGTFASGVSYGLGTTATASTLSFGDFNGDAKTDVVVSVAGNNVAGQEIVLLGNGDGTFQTTPKTSTGVYYPQFAAVGDFNGDGKLDLAVSAPEYCNGSCTIPATTYVLLGNGDGTVQAATSAFGANGPLAAADLNGDGKADLVIDNSPLTQVYLSNGGGTFSNASSYDLLVDGGVPAIADFNLDGKLDIAVGTMLLGNGDGTFQGVQASLLTTLSGQPPIAAAGDFDKNGTVDVAAIASTSLYILSNNGKGMLSLINTYTLPQPGYGIVTADFNGDGNLDVLVVGTDQTAQDLSYTVLLGNGDGSFQAPINYPQSVQTSAQSYSIVVADFNDDKKPDLAITLAGGAGNQSLALLLGNGDGTFAAPSYVYDGAATTLLTADFNGDGKLDIGGGVPAGGPSKNPSTALLYGNGDGTFQAAVFPASLNNFAASFAADLNDDGRPDLIAFYPPQVALENEDGTFTLLPALPNPVNLVADFNGDGKPDLFVTLGALGSQQTGVQLGNGDGTFGPVVNVPAKGLLSPSLAADMNGDGRLDLVFPWYNSGLGTATSGIGVLINTTAPGFGVLASPLSPAPVTAGNSATSTVTVVPAFGFNSAVSLACTGLPSGASCGFVPSSIANSSGTSALTIATSASVAAGTYSIQVQGSSGSVVNSMPLSVVVQAAPDFSLGASSGSATSQTITAGQTANFSLALAPTGSFAGTVDLSCAITPAVTPAPTCSLSSSSVQISGSGTQSVTVNVGTTAPATTGAVPGIKFPPGPMPMIMIWTLTLLASTWLWAQNRKRLPALAAPIVVLAFAFSVGCGGSSSSSTHTTPGTPSGTYAVTVTATSGSVSHNMALQVVVQ